MILEGIVTSLDDTDRLNVAPMGPIVEPAIQSLHLRPFNTSTTCRNLKERRCGVFHVTDDVLFLARAAIGELDDPGETFAAEYVDGVVLASACRWYEFRVEEIDDSRERNGIRAPVVHTGRLRDFFGFNRAKHAVLEAAILATRVHLLPADDILAQYEALKVPVEKTAGPQETEAFALLEEYVQRSCTAKSG